MIEDMVAETIDKWLLMDMPVAGVTSLAIGIGLRCKKGAASFPSQGCQGNNLQIWLPSGDRNKLKAEDLNRGRPGVLGVNNYVY